MAKSKKKTALYFTTVCAYPNNAAVFGGHLISEATEPRGTRFMIYNNGAWGFLTDVNEVVYASIVHLPKNETKRQRCILGRDGLYKEYQLGKDIVELPIDVDFGYMESLAVIEDSIFACGTQGQVYQRLQKYWKQVGDNLYIPFDGSNVKRSLLSISGFSKKNIFVCSAEGEVWQFNGTKWYKLKSPTKLSLHCVHCASDGNTYFSGANGGLYCFNEEGSWTDLSDRKLSKETLWDMVEFKGKIYIAADKKLLFLNKNKLEEIAGPEEGNFRILNIDASDDKIWCVGAEEVFNYDGKKWERLICPEN